MARRRRRRRAIALFAGLAAALVGLPILLVLPLRFVEPPTTAIVLATPGPTRRVVVPLGAMSPHLVRAVLAAEDDAFYLHHGFDFAQLREVFLARNERPIRGASTISQQTAKNLFLWSGRSYVRKLLEAYLTVWLELLLPKDRILELYLNLVECGDRAFGLETCARLHFGKPAKALAPEEAAALAAILPSPRRYRIRGDFVRARVGELLPRMAVPAPRPK